MRIDLFLLHDDLLDNGPRKCIVVSGKSLKEEINKYIENLISKGWTRRKLTFYFMNKLGFSESVCGSLVYLRKEFYHLVFLKELLKLDNSYEKKFELQEKIDFIKTCHPPLKIYKTPKRITSELCKIAGTHAADGTIHNNYFSISEGYISNIKAFKKWVNIVFGFNPKIKQISKKEWSITFNSKIISRYLTKIFDFPNGKKTPFVKMPPIIHASSKEMQNSFANGFMTFESGIGIKNEVELCVLSKQIVDDLEQVFKQSKLKFVKMKTQSGKYWRMWSGKMNSKETKKWLTFFEKGTYKYNRLLDHAEGYKNKATSFEHALKILNYAFPRKPNNKTSLQDLLLAIKKIKTGTRHDLKKAAGLKNFGGPWNGSLKPYISILEKAQIITTKIDKVNGKNCQIYTYNPQIQHWLLPSAKID
jgi:hypothetical protein